MKLNREYNNLIMQLAFLLLLQALLLGCMSNPAGNVTNEKIMKSSGKFGPKNFKRIIVLVQSSYQTRKYDRSIEDSAIKALINNGHSVPSRSDMEKIMQEINFQNSSITEANAAQIGKIMNAKAVFIPSVTKTRKQGQRTYATIGGRLINVETAEILWIDSISDSANTKYASKADLIESLASILTKNLIAY